jgi:predicted RNA-binding Zn ribbon-like protein
MNIPQLPPPILVGEHRALDFLNTVAVPIDTSVEWLSSGAALLDWMQQAGLIESDVAASFRGRSKELDAVAARTRELREWFRGFVQHHAGRALAPGAVRELDPLNRLLAIDETHRQVVPAEQRVSGQALQWARQRRWTAPRQLLQPIAEIMGDLVCHADFRLIRACEGPRCTLMFLDTTRSQARRWCNMSVCGNRAKVAAHRARQRVAKS